MPSRICGLSSATAPKSSRTIAAAGLDQHVPRVRIGVVDAVDEDHLAVERARGAARRPSCRSRARRGAATSLIFTPSTNVVVRTRPVQSSRTGPGKMTRASLGEVLRDALDVVGLEREVELLRQELADLVVVRVEPLHRHEELDDLHDAADRLQIEPHDPVDVAVLHLHADALAVDELGDVHLPERRARDRLAIERARCCFMRSPSSLSSVRRSLRRAAAAPGPAAPRARRGTRRAGSSP